MPKPKMEKPFSIVAAYWHGPKNSKKTLSQKLGDAMNCSGSCGLLVWGTSAKEAETRFRESRKGGDLLTARAEPITMENAWLLLGEGLNGWRIDHDIDSHPNKKKIQAKFQEILKIRDKMKNLFMEPSR